MKSTCLPAVAPGRADVNCGINQPSPDSIRSRNFSSSSEPRFWWHRREGTDYVPPIYSCLTNEEWTLLEEWFADTSRKNWAGEGAIPLLSLLQGLIMGNAIRRIVQLGTFAGYSALLLGFFLRQMNARHGLFTLEIGEHLCQYTNEWLNRADLRDFVCVEHRSSLDPVSPKLAIEYLGRAPELILIDSSHEYKATAQELEIWYPTLAPGGLLALHDTSQFAVDFDVTRQGGVARALEEWRARNPGVQTFSLNAGARFMEPPPSVYQDACGVGLIQKPMPNE